MNALLLALTLSVPVSAESVEPFLPRLAPAKRAVVVGIADYPAIARATDAQKRQFPELATQLQGGVNDAETMKLLFEASGYEVTLLTGSRATKGRIEEALANLENATKAGDVAAFFFSGRGSIAPGEGEVQPSLVAFDGSLTDPEGDVLMSRLESTAQKLANAQFVVILDTCFVRAGVRSRGQEYRHFRDVRKVIPRQGTVREPLFKAPALVMAAAGPTGAAFEWREDIQTNRWAGAFTSDLSGVLAGMLTEGQSLSYRDLLTTVNGAVMDRGRDGAYMPGYRIYPDVGDLGQLEARYRQPIPMSLSGAIPTTPDPVVRPQEVPKPVAAVAERRELFEKEFRIGFQFEESLPEARVRELQTQVADAKAVLEKIPDVRVVEQFGARPDRVLLVRAAEAGVRVSVANEPVGRGERIPAGEGKTLGEAVTALGESLERSAIVYAVTRTLSSGNATTRADVRLVVSKGEIRPTDTFDAEFSTTVKGFALLTSFNEGTGIVNLAGAFVHPVPNFSSTQGNRIITPLEGLTVQDPVAGRVVVRAIFLVENEAWRMPEGPFDPEKPPTLALLRSIRDALNSGKALWQGVRVDVRIVQ